MTEPKAESVLSASTADGYFEGEPTEVEWIREQIPTRNDVVHYIKSLFPFTHWITRYNFQWFIGDLIAGVTVGAVVVPQSMAYAKLANLAPEFGLYSSFMGVLIYWFFATSKDITIGPVAVLSTVVGNVLTKVAKKLPKTPAHEVAGSLALISGCIVFFIGLVRLGWIVEFISLTAIAAYMTGSAVNIAVGQVPGLMGITGFSNRDATYRVVINTLKHLGRTKLDAAMGLTALLMLYLIRGACSYSAKRYPQKSKLFFFISTLRTAFVILLYTMISWLVNRHHKKKPKFAILGTVPRGFQDAGAPTVNTTIIKAFASELPAVVIVMLIEHISIAKSFGRVNNYVINPSQELIAMGITNILGPFVGAYPATGSFSRTAIKAKAGVRTPLAGVITAIVVLIAIYALMAVFFYIPSATLSAIIIHAVGDLITSPRTLLKFWRISPLEVPIFLAGVLVTVFSSIENGIYTTISVSAALLLFRVFKAQGRFLGRVRIHSVLGDDIPDGTSSPNKDGSAAVSTTLQGFQNFKSYRHAFLPIDHEDGSNPAIELSTPYPGIFIFRFSEGYNYPNAHHYTEYLVNYIFAHTRRTNLKAYLKRGDRPWNDPGPSRFSKDQEQVDDTRPTLKAIILDFSSVNNVDVTSVQNLIDVRNQLNRYAAPDTVDWHFASINNRWTKRSLAVAGFGLPSVPATATESPTHQVKPIFSVAETGGADSAARAAELDELVRFRSLNPGASDIETGLSAKEAKEEMRLAAVYGVNLPLFHIDLTSALQSALIRSRANEQHAAKILETEGNGSQTSYNPVKV